MSQRSIEEIMTDLTVSVRNSTLETAAKVARLYGATEEVCQHILMLKGDAADRILAQFEVPNV